jgi:hypothetical protein
MLMVLFVQNSVRLVRCGRYIGWLCVWWDADCSILNSRNRHEFEVPDGARPLVCLGLDDSSDHMEVVLIPSDGDGNMPLAPLCLGKCKLPLTALGMILGRAGFSQTVNLPIELDFQSGGSLSETMEVKVALSHRIVPASIQKRDLEMFPQQQPHVAAGAEPSFLADPRASTESGISRRDPACQSLVVKLDRIVHLPEHEYSSGEKNVYLTCSLKNVAVDRAVCSTTSFYLLS